MGRLRPNGPICAEAQIRKTKSSSQRKALAVAGAAKRDRNDQWDRRRFSKSFSGNLKTKPTISANFKKARFFIYYF